MTSLRVVACGVLLAVTGCGPTTFKDACVDSINALCRQLYRCQPDTARKVWPNIQDCATELFNSSPQCVAAENMSCRIDPYLSSACIDDVDNLRCDEPLVIPPSCALECL